MKKVLILVTLFFLSTSAAIAQDICNDIDQRQSILEDKINYFVRNIINSKNIFDEKEYLEITNQLEMIDKCNLNDDYQLNSQENLWNALYQANEINSLKNALREEKGMYPTTKELMRIYFSHKN